MKTYKFILLSIVVIIAISCSKDNSLDNSVFVYDDNYTELPAYSEWGYNTFGAYYDRQIFISTTKIVPIKATSTNGTFTFSLNGQINDADNSYVKKAMEMRFVFPGFSPQKYSDLVVLNDTIFNLTGSLCQTHITIDTTEVVAQILSGELYFKRAQNLFVDNKSIEVILSGYFNLKLMINNKPITISNGRFDVGVSDNNFYVF